MKPMHTTVYCTLLWFIPILFTAWASTYSCANKTSLYRLKVKQKEAIRIICNVGYREHTAPLFAQLKILPLDQLIELSILKFMHSFKHNMLPLSFTNMWQTNRNRLPDRELRNADQLYIPPHRFATLKRLPGTHV